MQPYPWCEAVNTDKQILFATLARRLDLLTDAQFLEAAAQAAEHPEVDLAHWLSERGWISSDDLVHLQYLIERQLSQCGQDARAALTRQDVDPFRQTLSASNDPRLQKYLQALIRPAPVEGHGAQATLPLGPRHELVSTLDRKSVV